MSIVEYAEKFSAYICGRSKSNFSKNSKSSLLGVALFLLQEG